MKGLVSCSRTKHRHLPRVPRLTWFHMPLRRTSVMWLHNAVQSGREVRLSLCTTHPPTPVFFSACRGYVFKERECVCQKDQSHRNIVFSDVWSGGSLGMMNSKATPTLPRWHLMQQDVTQLFSFKLLFPISATCLCARLWASVVSFSSPSRWE